MSEPARRPSILRGIALLARFRREGFAEFSATPQAFLNSLAPLIAFPLVGALLVLGSGVGIGLVLGDLLATVVALLTPAVVSEALATRWGRRGAWLRYAVAFNWSQWSVPIVAVGLLFGMGLLRSLGLSERGAAMAVLFAIAAYGMGLHWFLARHGLGLGRGKAVVMVVAINLAMVALVLGPRYFAPPAKPGNTEVFQIQ